MEKRIELEKRARKASQITELNLDNCRSTSIVGFTDEYTALETLSLINVGLTTLKGFPKLPNLKKLELSDNRISNGLNYLTTSPKLQYLNLSGNKIKDLDALKPLEEFKNLAVLDLFNNEATQIENYREKIFKMLPSLKFLDGFDCNDVEAPSDGDDDEDANGNDSDDEEPRNAFCLNGLEIDLDALAELEKRVQAKKDKKAAAASSVAQPTGDSNKVPAESDDLDEYLKELKIKEASNQSAAAERNANETISPQQQRSNPISFAILLYWFLAILNLANAAAFSSSSPLDDLDDDDDDPDDCESEEDFDDEYNSDVSLSEVYNDDLEEDNSDWGGVDGVEGGDADGIDDDVDSDGDETDGGANESVNKSANKTTEQKVDGQEAADDEPQARGKKRKHDG